QAEAAAVASLVGRIAAAVSHPSELEPQPAIVPLAAGLSAGAPGHRRLLRPSSSHPGGEYTSGGHPEWMPARRVRRLLDPAEQQPPGGHFSSAASVDSSAVSASASTAASSAASSVSVGASSAAGAAAAVACSASFTVACFGE